MIDVREMIKEMHTTLENRSCTNEAESEQVKQKDKTRTSPPSYPSVGIGANVVRLPLWRDFERAAPSCVLRSALFGVVKRGKRRYLRDEILKSWGNDKIEFRGERLDQADLDVWLECLHLVRDTYLGKTVAFEKYAFLRQLGRSTGRQNWKWLESSIKRMTACAVTIRTGTRSYFGSLVEKGFTDHEMGRYVIVLNTELVELFRAGYTFQHAEKRRLLNTDLAKWLCGYFESHKATEDEPHRIGVKTLHELCGSETHDLWKFRQSLKKAVNQIQVQQVIKKWEISKKDILVVVKF